MKYIIGGFVGAVVVFGLLYLMCAVSQCSTNTCDWTQGVRDTLAIGVFVGTCFGAGIGLWEKTVTLFAEQK
jgi:hypothetical protein